MRIYRSIVYLLTMGHIVMFQVVIYGMSRIDRTDELEITGVHFLL